MSALPKSAVPTSVIKPLKVLVVDDSPTMRLLLQEIINRQNDMRVVGTAENPLVAREMIKELEPDLLTLDIEMPGMNGIDFLERVMRLRPMPVLMISSACENGSELAMEALELGAVDFVRKRAAGSREGLAEMARELVDKIRQAASSRAISQTRTLQVAKPSAVLAQAVFPQNRLICVGASTGGTEAIKAFLEAMPANSPAILIAQHMPDGFTTRFAARLDAVCRIVVKEAEHQEIARQGVAYIAPGHSHLTMRRLPSGDYQLLLSQTPEVNRHRPSVDVLFHAAARELGKRAVGILLTGMGRDGAAGMAAMHDAGAYTLAQDAASCIVYGMPRAAVELGAVDDSAAPAELAVMALTRLAVQPGKRPTPA